MFLEEEEFHSVKFFLLTYKKSLENKSIKEVENLRCWLKPPLDDQDPGNQLNVKAWELGNVQTLLPAILFVSFSNKTSYMCLKITTGSLERLDTLELRIFRTIHSHRTYLRYKRPQF